MDVGICAVRHGVRIMGVLAEVMFYFISDVCFQHYFQDSNVPVMMVACKTEHKDVQQDYELQPAEFCKKYKLPPPQMYTCLDHINKKIYAKLATLAAYPYVLYLTVVVLIC